MLKAQSLTRFFFYSVWAVLMTLTTYVLGAAPLKVLREHVGRVWFWLWSIALSAGFYGAGLKPLGIGFLSLVVLVGVFVELEELHLSFLLSAFFTLMIQVLIAGGAMALWMSRVGPRWLTDLRTAIEAVGQQLARWNPGLPSDYADLFLQVLPSAAVVLWMSALYLAVLLEGRLKPQGKLLSARPSMRSQLADLRMPDFVVWVFIAALFCAFSGVVQKSVEVVAINVLNVCALLFFMQGIGVVSRFFAKLRLGSFWQVAFMVLIVIHLFLVVSLLGLMDYWADFRARINRQTQQYNRET